MEPRRDFRLLAISIFIVIALYMFLGRSDCNSAG